MRTKHLLFAFSALFLAACGKDSDNPTPTPTIYAKWHLQNTQQIVIGFKGGVATVPDTTNINGAANNYWEFKQNGILIIADPQLNGQTSFSLVGDSILIEPGSLFSGKARYKITKLDMSGNMQLTTGSTNKPYLGFDSARIKIINNFTR